jgi:SAM-dependent methyltransferase
MKPQDFPALLTAAGQAALLEAEALQPREVDFLKYFTVLRKRHERELARNALATAILRREASAKLPQAGQMYFTREALEQATPWVVSQHRAARFAGYARILDLGCSIGGDSLALAQKAPVIGIELDALRGVIARANAAALSKDVHVLRGDVRHLPFDLRAMKDNAAFFDPARRADRKRAFSVERYSPPLSIIQGWLPHVPALAVKVSPGVNLSELAGYDCEIEFISHNGDLKEALLWFGAFKGPRFRATVLEAEGAAHTITREEHSPVIPISVPRAYLYEPDSAILRAGLVTHLGETLGGAQLDPHIAYLTADRRIETPFARVWAVEGWMPFQLKKLRAYLRERDVGSVTVKKRGSPITPEQLIAGLRLKGENEKVLFLTRQADKPIIVIATPHQTGGQGYEKRSSTG